MSFSIEELEMMLEALKEYRNTNDVLDSDEVQDLIDKLIETIDKESY